MLVPLVTHLEQLSREERVVRLRRIRHDDPVTAPATVTPDKVEPKEESAQRSASPEAAAPAPAPVLVQQAIPVLSPAKHAIIARSDNRAVITWVGPGSNLSIGLERLWEFYYTGTPGVQPAFCTVSDGQFNIDSSLAYWQPGKNWAQRMGEYRPLLRELDSISQQGQRKVEAITALCKMAKVSLLLLVLFRA